jgi:hypothetical protein
LLYNSKDRASFHTKGGCDWRDLDTSFRVVQEEPDVTTERTIVVYTVPCVTSRQEVRSILSRACTRFGGLFKDEIRAFNLETARLPNLIAAIEECYARDAVLWTPSSSLAEISGFFAVAIQHCHIEVVFLDNTGMSKYEAFRDRDWSKHVGLIIELRQRFEIAEVKRRSRRIKEGMARAKKAGVKLGNPDIGSAQAKSREGYTERRPPADVTKLMISWRKQGLSFRVIAERLNEKHINSPMKKRWHGPSVRNVLKAFGCS